MATMFRRLPPSGGTPREISEVVNNALNGKINSTGTITLATGGATSTTLFDERISPDSKIILVPKSTAALDDAAPYALLLCTAGQTAAAANTAYALGTNTVVLASGVSVVSSTRITVANKGVYNVQFSVQLSNEDNAQHNIDVWFRVNGTDVPNSNSIFTVPERKSASIFGKVIGTVNTFLDLEASDYVEIVWSTPSTLVIVQTVGAQTSPTRPVTPCLIVTVNYVAPQAYSNIYATAQTNGQATIEHWANSTADKTYAYVVLG
jgi:hypothetical protein